MQSDRVVVPNLHHICRLRQAEVLPTQTGAGSRSPPCLSCRQPRFFGCTRILSCAPERRSRAQGRPARKIRTPCEGVSSPVDWEHCNDHVYGYTHSGSGYRSGAIPVPAANFEDDFSPLFFSIGRQRFCSFSTGHNESPSVVCLTLDNNGLVQCGLIETPPLR